MSESKDPFVFGKIAHESGVLSSSFDTRPTMNGFNIAACRLLRDLLNLPDFQHIEIDASMEKSIVRIRIDMPLQCDEQTLKKLAEITKRKNPPE